MVLVSNVVHIPYHKVQGYVVNTVKKFDVGIQMNTLQERENVFLVNLMK